MERVRAKILKDGSVFIADTVVLLEESFGLKRSWGGTFQSDVSIKFNITDNPLTLVVADGRSGDIYIDKITTRDVKTFTFLGVGSLSREQ
jgi:hypothetical protein